MGKALKSATFGRADTPILSISVNLLQQSGAAGESKTVSELEPTLSDAVIATVNAETEDPLRFLISQLDSDKRFSQSYERAESLGVSEAVLDDITDRLASGELVSVAMHRAGGPHRDDRLIPIDPYWSILIPIDPY